MCTLCFMCLMMDWGWQWMSTLCEKLKGPDFLPDAELQDLLQDVLPLGFLHDAHSFQLSVCQSHQSPPWAGKQTTLKVKGQKEQEASWKLICTAGDTVMQIKHLCLWKNRARKQIRSEDYSRVIMLIRELFKVATCFWHKIVFKTLISIKG